MRQIAAMTGDKVRLGPGTLYGSIQTLLEAQLIEQLDERDRRRYYRITPAAGRKLARSEAGRLARMVLARAQRLFRGAYV